jgi:hypothetical protein
MSQLSLLPAFEPSWEGERHARAVEHARASEERAQLYGLIDGTDDDERTRQFRARVELDGYVYPYCSFERLSVVGGFNQWLYFLDEQYDGHPESYADLQRIREVMQRALDVLAGAPLGHLPTPFERYTRACRRELWALMPSGFLERFSQNLRDSLLRGRLLALGHWLRRETLGLDQYIELRALASTVYPVIDCVEIAADIRLAPEVLTDPVLVQMVNATVRYVALMNDVLSYEAEAAAAASTVNLVHVLRVRENRDGESALQRAAAIVGGFERTFCRLEQRLPSYGRAVDEQVTHYVRGLKSWMRGSLDFALHSERFRSGTSPLGEVPASPARSA